MAGEVVAIGEDVKKWQVGDRVTSNFTLDHIAGDITPAVQKTALGGLLDGVLSEYKLFPEHVSGRFALRNHFTLTFPVVLTPHSRVHELPRSVHLAVSQ